MSTGLSSRNPAWLPDGKWLTYDDTDRVWIADPDSGSIRSLTESDVPGFLRWSPTGTEVIYSVPGAIRVTRLDGTILSTYQTPVLDFESPFSSFSLDGMRVAVPRPYGGSIRIIISNLDGSGETVVSSSAAYQPWWRP